MTSIKETPEDIAWYSVPTQDAPRRLDVVPDRGLEDYEGDAAAGRAPEPNELPRGRTPVAGGRSPGGSCSTR